LCCGRRWGKTTLAVEEIKGAALYKESRVAYIAPTYQQARDIAWQMLVKELKPITKKANESRLELEVLTKDGGTSIIQLRGWEAVETLRGQAFHFIVIDEVAMMRNFWINWQEVIRPTLTDTQGQVMFISTPKGFNHFYDLFNEEAKDTDYKSFHFTSYDNPHLPKEELDKAKEELTEDRFAQEYMADWRKTSGLVYKEFRRESHVYESHEINKVKTIAGVDFGYTNPACALKIIVDSDNRYFVSDEWYKTKQTTEQLIQIVKSFDPQEVYPDPAEPDRIEEMNRQGLNCREVSKEIAAGVDKVRELFKQNRIHIHRDCRNLIWELETYHYPDKKPEQNEKEVPVKENDHAVDALRYALYTIDPMQQNFNFTLEQNEW
jgi:PBSX family phage terminase large subunit